MGTYTPLDLNSLYNAGLDILGGQGTLGAQSFRGLPFALGSDAERCLIACSGERSGVEIPVGRRVTWMIVAHRLLESRIADNGPLATLVAEYALHYEDGDVLKVPVRDRFEISTVPSSYGGTPFVAVPDTSDQLLPRTEGPWDMAGRRQTEVDGGRAQHFVLWAWPNPHPDKGLEKIAIEAAGPAFVIGGITLSDLDEEPICREGTREVIITLPQEEDARSPPLSKWKSIEALRPIPIHCRRKRPRILSTGAKAGAKLKTRAAAPHTWK